MRRLALISIITLCGCFTPVEETGPGTPPSVQPGSANATTTVSACSAKSTSTLPDVSIKFPDQPCEYTLAQAAAGALFKYEVKVGAAWAVKTTPQNCSTPGPSGLVVHEEVSGANGALYCLCDVGNCPHETLASVLNVGSHSAAFAWDGTNWTGPSDYGAPKGAPFAPGTYEFVVTASGTVSSSGQPFTVEGRMQFTLKP